LVLWSISSSTSCEGEELVGVPHYPNWTTFSRSSIYSSNSPQVIIYINIYISSLHFNLQNDILNYRDISYISFFNQGSILFLINVYLDSSQLALKYLKDTEVNLNWIESRNINSQLLKLFSTMADLVSSWTTCGMAFIVCSIQHNLVKLTFNYWMKS